MLKCPDHRVFELLLLTLIFGWGKSASPQVSFSESDRLTYRLFREQKWDSLITAGKEALHSGIDYYYLRSRLGTAYQNTNKPFRAAEHFSAALEFNRAEPYARDGLYLSYLNSGLPDLARALTGKMTPEEKQALGVSNSTLSQVYIELGGTLSNAFASSSPSSLMGPDSIYGEQDIYGNDYYGHLSFTLNITPSLSLYLGGNYLNFAKRKLFQYTVTDDRKDSTVNYPWGFRNYYSFPVSTVSSTFNYFITQTEFALGGTLVTAPGVKIMPLFRLINVRYYNTRAESETTIQADTSAYASGSGIYYTFPFVSLRYGYRQNDTSYNNYLVSLMATRQFGIYTVGMSGSWSNLNGDQQAQVSGQLTYYPCGTPYLYGTTAVTGLFADGDGRVIGSQVIGGRIWKWIWGEASFLYGDLTNGNLGNGMIVYNNTGKIKYRAGAQLIFAVLPNLQVCLNYLYFSQQSAITYYVSESNGTTDVPVPHVRWDPYHTNSLFAGLRINL